MSKQVYILLLLIVYISCRLYVYTENDTVILTKDAPCQRNVKYRVPISFHNVTAELVYQDANSTFMDGKILVMAPADPNDLRALNLSRGSKIVGLITLSAETTAGLGCYMVNDFKNPFIPWIDVPITDKDNLIKWAKEGIVVTITDEGLNEWKKFLDSGVILIFQIILWPANVVIIFMCAYAFINVQQISKQYIYLVSLIFETLGALSKILFYTDPYGHYKVMTSYVENTLVWYCFPFGLMNCLLLALFFQESMNAKDVKIYRFITNRTRWIFFLFCGILIVLLILLGILRPYPGFETVRTAIVVVIIVEASLVAIFYTVTAVQIVQKIKEFKTQKNSKLRKLQVRFAVTAGCLYVVIIMMALSRAVRTPAPIAVIGWLLLMSFTTIGIVNSLSFILLNRKKKKSVSRTAKTASGVTTNNDTKNSDESSSSSS